MAEVVAAPTRLEDELWHRRFLTFAREVELAALAQEEYAPGLAAELALPAIQQKDTLTRVRVRPFARAVANHLRRKPDDDLADLYDPDTYTRQFYHPSEEMNYLSSAPVRVGNVDLDPPSPHVFQLPRPRLDKKRGQLVIECEPRMVRTAQQLRDLSETAEWRRARFAEATGDWVRRAPSPQDYKRYVEANGALPDFWKLAQTRMLERELPLDSPQLAKLREASMREGDSDPWWDRAPSDTATARGVSANIDTQFIPIVGGTYNRQLYFFAHWEATAKAFEMRHHSELANAAVNINTDFTLGRGVNWKVENQAVNDVFQEFWDRNKMPGRIRDMMDDFTWQGELLVRKFELVKGFLCIRSIDPGNFYEIVTAPEDVETVFYYAQQNPTPWQLIHFGLRGQQINIPSTRYVIRQYPANEIFHLKNNVSSSEKWGRSDFYAALGTLKRHRDWTNASTLKDMLQANLVWAVTITGDQADVTAFMQDPANMQLPGPGGTWVQNTAVTLAPMHSDVAQAGRGNQGNTGTFLTALFATSQNMPLSYFNSQAGGSARATALTQGEPFVKKISTRQQQLRILLDHLYEEVMRRAVQAGRLAADAVRHEDADPEWVFPSPQEEDRGAKFRDLKDARELMVISHRSMAVQMAKDLGQEEYDYDDEQETIEEERQQGEMQTWPLDTEVAVQLGQQPQGAQPQTPPGMPGMPPGLGGPPGQPAGQEAMQQGGQPQLPAPPEQGAPAGMPPEQAPPQIGLHEQITGADATHAFRLQQGNKEAGLPQLTAEETRFLEAALPNWPIEIPAIVLPTGRIARLVEANAPHEATPRRARSKARVAICKHCSSPIYRQGDGGDWKHTPVSSPAPRTHLVEAGPGRTDPGAHDPTTGKWASTNGPDGKPTIEQEMRTGKWKDAKPEKLIPDEEKKREELNTSPEEHAQNRALARWVTEHPVLSKLEESSRSAESSQKDNQDTKGNYTPEAQALHLRIVNEIIGGDEKLPPKGEPPHYLSIIGLPASGKTSGEGGKIDKSKYVVIDPDAIKQRLAAARGDQNWEQRTSYYHEESSDVSKMLQDRALAEGRNVLKDGVGDEPAKVLKQIQAAKNLGYEPEVIAIAVNPQEAVARAIKRWEGGGRWVPLTRTLMELGRKPERTYDQVRKIVKKARMISGETGETLHAQGV